MEAIDGLSSETIVRLFNKHNTTDLRMFWDKTQSDYKDNELKKIRSEIVWHRLFAVPTFIRHFRSHIVGRKLLV